MKLLLLLFIVSFRLLAASPEPASSKFFHTEGGGFVMAGEDDERIVQYAVTLKILRAIPKGSLLFFKFENPLAKTKPLKVKIVYNGEKQITVKSEAVWGLKPNGVYTCFVSLRSSEKVESQIGSHRQELLFGMSEHQYENLMMPWYKEKTEQNKPEISSPITPRVD
jgi:hypothetical protein